MNDIKFRCWSKLKKQWFHHTLLLACIDGLPFAHFVEVFEDKSIKHHVYNASNLDLVIQQYTNLKDRDGKDIYIGDIIQWEDDGETWTRKVIFNNGYVAYEKLDPKYRGDMLSGICGICKVIGNICENPEIKTDEDITRNI